MATLNNEDAEKAYRHQGFYINFPDRVIKKAKGKVTERGFILNNPDYLDRTPQFLDSKGIVRNVLCKVPDAPEAIDILEKEMMKFDKSSWIEDRPTAKEPKNKNLGSVKAQSGEWVQECTFTPTGASVTILGPDGEEEYTIYFYTVDCTWVYQEGDGGGGFGGGGGDTGDNDDPSNNCVNPWDLCVDDGEGGSPPPNEELIPPASFDDILIIEDPDCSKPYDDSSLYSRKIYDIFCKSYNPTGNQLTKINDAIDEIESRDGVCEDIANEARNLLSINRFKLFQHEEGEPGGIGGPMGSSLSFVSIAEKYLNYTTETVSVVGLTNTGQTYEHEVNLEWLIAHEIDHVLGFNEPDHMNGDPWLTPNVQECSGLE